MFLSSADFFPNCFSQHSFRDTFRVSNGLKVFAKVINGSEVQIRNQKHYIFPLTYTFTNFSATTLLTAWTSNNKVQFNWSVHIDEQALLDTKYQIMTGLEPVSSVKLLFRSARVFPEDTPQSSKSDQVIYYLASFDSPWLIP